MFLMGQDVHSRFYSDVVMMWCDLLTDITYEPCLINLVQSYLVFFSYLAPMPLVGDVLMLSISLFFSLYVELW